MTMLLEEIVLLAQERLSRQGRLDIESYAMDHPEHEAELRRVLPAMLAVHREKLVKELEAETFEYAIRLFSLPRDEQAPSTITVGALITAEIDRIDQSIAGYSKRTKLPISAISQLMEDPTPVEIVKSTVVKELASRVSAPFSALLIELNRLVSLRKTTLTESSLVFTRDTSTSSDTEHRELVEKVMQSTRRSTNTVD